MNAAEARRLTNEAIAQIDVSRHIEAIKQRIRTAIQSQESRVRFFTDGINGSSHPTSTELWEIRRVLEKEGYGVTTFRESGVRIAGWGAMKSQRTGLDISW